MTDTQLAKRPIVFPLALIVFGIIGWWAAFSLTVEKFEMILHPGDALACDFSLLVQCAKNLGSWQGSVFGFPNPIIGLAGWMAPIVVGAALLAGARFDRWFWITFTVGAAAALGFVVWLISQSIFVLGTLCPWCMVTWSVTIPMFWLVTIFTLSNGTIPLPGRGRRFFESAYSWVPAITVLSYIVVAVIAQARLDVLSYL